MTRSLTGIKPTGTPHLGNLLGAIRPAMRLAEQGEAMYFIADYHAVTTTPEPAALARWTHEVAASWLANGLDPERVVFYRQSDVPEIFELAWVLACITPKGWMNKAHAYKAAVASNLEGGVDPDAGINMGLYGYPVLMAADILAFDIDFVPVGEDQDQHVEIARDIAQRLNHAYGPVLHMPAAKIDAITAIVPGLDGRKMSKSYGNTIPLGVEPAQLRKLVSRIATDSTPPEAPKQPDTSTIFQLYRAVATPEETNALAERFRAGIGWGDAKRILADRIEAELAPTRARYNDLMANPAEIEALLVDGARRARAIARPVLDRVRQAIGIARRAE
jgi:tryptophanyl-tRNA synthetase